MIRNRWRALLRAAKNEREVVVLVRSYLEAWHPDEVQWLPADAWPERIESPKDVSTSTFRIAKIRTEYRGPNSSQLNLLQDLLLFMTEASVRITQLAAVEGAASEMKATEPEEGIGGPVPTPAKDTRRCKADDTGE